MSFADKQLSPVPGHDGPITFELGRAGWRSGIAVELHTDVTVHSVREVLTDAFDWAGKHAITFSRDVVEPGWWAIALGLACTSYGPARIARSGLKPRRHVVVQVGDYDMAGRPDWPLVRLAPSMPWLDLRTPECLKHGPTSTELDMYRHAADRPDLQPSEVLRQFELGVLEWIPGEPKNRLRGIRAVGSR